MPIDANQLPVSVVGSSQSLTASGLRLVEVVDADGYGYVDFKLDGRAVGWDYDPATDSVRLVAANGDAVPLARAGDYWRWQVAPGDLRSASVAPGSTFATTGHVVVERVAGGDPATNPPLRWASRSFAVQIERKLGFSPDQVAGLELWLDAYDLASLANGAPVSSWPDRSPYGRVASEATNAPTKQTDGSGRPLVLFDGSNDVLATSWAQFGDPCTLFVAAQADSADGTVRGIVQVGGTNGARLAFNSSNLKGISGTDTADTSLPALDTPFVGTVTKAASGNVTVRRNLDAAVSQASSAAVTDGTVQVGDTAADSPAACRVYEVAVYSSVLAAAEQARIVRALMKKWGVA